MKINSVQAFNDALPFQDQKICHALREIFDRGLPEAECKIWHAHPVWFLAGNPIVGYSKLKSCVRVMFWSGQSFGLAGLEKTGTFKAAEIRYTAHDQVNAANLERWIDEARHIQWDYKNLMKRGRLERIPLESDRRSGNSATT